MDMARFIENWTEPSQPTFKVSQGTIDAIENEYDTLLEDDYRTAILRHGVPNLAKKLPILMVYKGWEWNVVKFVEPRLIIQQTNDLRKFNSLPGDQIVIARDSIDRAILLPIVAQIYEDTLYPIAVYDTRYNDIIDIAPSFGAWIDMMNDLADVHQPIAVAVPRVEPLPLIPVRAHYLRRSRARPWTDKN